MEETMEQARIRMLEDIVKTAMHAADASEAVKAKVAAYGRFLTERSQAERPPAAELLTQTLTGILARLTALERAAAPQNG